MNSRCITMMSVSQACGPQIMKLEDCSIMNLNKETYEACKKASLFIVFDQTHYRILKDLHNNFLADKKISITLLSEEIRDYLKDEVYV